MTYSSATQVTTVGGTLGRRVNQILHTPLDGPESRSALEALVSSYVTEKGNGSSTQALSEILTTHRDLRADMQEQAAKVDADFLAALQSVDSVFSELEDAVADIDRQCTELRTKVDSALYHTAGVAEQTSLLVDERNDLQMRLKITTSFISQFSLTEAETRRIGMSQSDSSFRSDIVIDDEYFATLDKLSRIRLEWQKLMPVESQAAVHDLATQLADQEETAYNNLLRWVLSSVRELSRGSPEFSAQLKQALQRLQTHQTLFDVAINEIAKVRREALARSFIDALVRGGPNGIPRPIEIHAADPQRFIGDMLAWVHQTYASENELLDTLLLLQARTERDKIKARLLGMSLENLARPLEIRIMQTTAEMQSPTALYRIDNLLTFYSDLFSVACPRDSAFMVTITGLCHDTHDRLLGILNALVDEATTAIASATPTLDVPFQLKALFGTLAEIIQLHEESFTASSISGQPKSESESKDAKSVLDDVTKMLETITHEANALLSQDNEHPLQPYEALIFEANLLLLCKDSFEQYSSLRVWNIKCTAEGERNSDDLCTQITEILKRKSCLPFDTPISDLSESVLEASLKEFNNALQNTSNLDSARLLGRLDDRALARLISQRAASSFVDCYTQIHSAISERLKDLSDDSGNSMVMLLHSPETIKSLI